MTLLLSKMQSGEKSISILMKNTRNKVCSWCILRFINILVIWSFTEYIDLTSTDADKPIPYWLKDLQLYEADRQSLSLGKWLTDSIIDADQVLLTQAHPHVGGLESVILGETLAFTIQRGEFVQILDVSNNHWTNIGCSPGTVNIVFPATPSPLAQRSTLQQYSSMTKHTSNYNLNRCRHSMEAPTVEFLPLRLQLHCVPGRTILK